MASPYYFFGAGAPASAAGAVLMFIPGIGSGVPSLSTLIVRVVEFHGPATGL